MLKCKVIAIRTSRLTSGKDTKLSIFNFLSSMGLHNNSKIFGGRYTAQYDKPFVLFLVGMRINQIWKFHKWIPVFFAMIPMLTALDKNKEKGLLGLQTWLSWGEVMVVQYWNSYDQLEHFSQSMNDPHLKPWKNYNKSIGSSGVVGIWHETYLVEPSSFECVHVNMPLGGLPKATKHIPVGSQSTSKSRLKGEL